MTRNVVGATQRASLVRRCAVIGGLLAAAVFVLLRAIHLAADFPANITTSSDLYTDEGWYANAALRFHLGGHWYAPGDFNPIVNLPVFQFVQAGVLGIGGVGLIPARLTVVASFALVMVLAYRLVARSFSTGIATLALVLLATNILLFAYSRFAIIEVPMTMLMLAAVVLLSGSRLRSWPVAAAACCLSLALLMKATAIAVLPALPYLVWTNPGERRHRALHYALLAAALLLVVLYHVLARLLYPQDYVYFNTRNFADRIDLDPSTIVANISAALTGGLVIDRFAYAATLAVGPVLYFRVLRRSRVAVALGLWIVSALAVLGTLSYHPARYYVPLAVPILLLGTVCAGTMWE